MEGNESDELKVEVSVDEEKPAPEECAFSGSQSEGDGRHREATPRYCRWLLQMDSARFNSALQITFAVLLGIALLHVFYMDLTFSIRVYWSYGNWTWISHVFTIFVNISMALFAALFALCVDVERPGLKLQPVLKRVVCRVTRTFTRWKNVTTGYTLTHFT